MVLPQPEVTEVRAAEVTKDGCIIQLLMWVWTHPFHAVAEEPGTEMVVGAMMAAPIRVVTMTAVEV